MDGRAAAAACSTFGASESDSCRRRSAAAAKGRRDRHEHRLRVDTMHADVEVPNLEEVRFDQLQRTNGTWSTFAKTESVSARAGSVVRNRPIQCLGRRTRSPSIITTPRTPSLLHAPSSCGQNIRWEYPPGVTDGRDTPAKIAKGHLRADKRRRRGALSPPARHLLSLGSDGDARPETKGPG